MAHKVVSEKAWIADSERLDGGWNALARPVKGGYYAIVTASLAATSSFEKMLGECLTWDA